MNKGYNSHLAIIRTHSVTELSAYIGPDSRLCSQRECTSRAVNLKRIWPRRASKARAVHPTGGEGAFFCGGGAGADTGFFFFLGGGGSSDPPPYGCLQFCVCLLICPGPCNNLDPLLKFLYEPPPPSECTTPPPPSESWIRVWGVGGGGI